MPKDPEAPPILDGQTTIEDVIDDEQPCTDCMAWRTAVYQCPA